MVPTYYCILCIHRNVDNTKSKKQWSVKPKGKEVPKEVQRHVVGCDWGGLGMLRSKQLEKLNSISRI